MTVLRELFVLLGLKVDKAKFDQAEKRLKKLFNAAEKVVTVTARVGEAIFRQAVAIADSTSELDRYQRQIGGTIQDLAAFRFAARAVGLESKRAFEVITELGERASDVIRNDKKFTSEAAEGFKALGLTSAAALKNANGQLKSGFELFELLIDRLPRLGVEADRTGVLMRTLGDDVGRMFAGIDLEAFQAFRKEARAFGITVTKADVALGRKFNASLNILIAQLETLRDRLGSSLLPVINRVILRVRAWLAANKEFVESDFAIWLDRVSRALATVFDAAKTVFGVFERLGFLVGALIDRLGGLKTILKVVGLVAGVFLLAKLGALAGAIFLVFEMFQLLIVVKVAAFFKAIMVALSSGLVPALKSGIAALRAFAAAHGAAFAKLVLTGALVAAVILILDELIETLRGGPTVIGRFSDALRKPIAEDDVPLIKVLKTMVTWLDRLVELGADVFNLFEGGAIGRNAERSLRSKALRAIGRILGKDEEAINKEVENLNQQIALGDAILRREEADRRNQRRRDVNAINSLRGPVLAPVAAPPLPVPPAPPGGFGGASVPGVGGPNITVRADTQINIQGPVTPETISDVRKGAEDGVGAGIDAAGQRFSQ